MPKKLYERGPAMEPRRLFEGPTLEQIDQAKRGARTPEAIEKGRDLIRKGVGVPPRSGGNGKTNGNGSDPPIKTKFE